MRLFILSLAALAILPLSACNAEEKTAVVSDNAASLNIVVVDIQQLMGASKAAKSIQAQGKDLREKYQKQIAGLEEDLKKAEQKIIDAGKEKNQEKFMENRKNFQKQLVEGQKKIAEINADMDKAIGNALNELRDEIVDIVGEMATDNNYDLVISRADVVIVSKTIDITADVMDKLNKSLKSVKVKG